MEITTEQLALMMPIIAVLFGGAIPIVIFLLKFLRRRHFPMQEKQVVPVLMHEHRRAGLLRRGGAIDRRRFGHFAVERSNADATLSQT